MMGKASNTIGPTDDEGRWREKFEFMLSLIREPRYLLSETLVAEQLKLTLKQQAFQLEKAMLMRSIEEYRQRTAINPAMDQQLRYFHT